MTIYTILDTRNKHEYDVLREYVIVFGTHNELTCKVASMLGVLPDYVYVLGGKFYVV